MGKVTSEVSGIGLRISARPDGSVRAAYLRIKDGKIARTREIVPNRLLVDEESNGSPVGIEVLGPISLRTIANLVPRDQGRRMVAQFAKAAMPKDLIASARHRSVNGNRSDAGASNRIQSNRTKKTSGR